MTVVAVDLGGTRLKAQRVSEQEPVPTEVFTLEHAGDWRNGIAKVRAEFHDLEQMALCVPGVVEDRRVVALPGKLPGIEGVDLAEEFDVPLLVTNDAIAYGVGEALHGAGRGHDRVLSVTLGTGVGVAVVEDGIPLGRGPLGGGILGGQIPLPVGAGTAVDTSGRPNTFEAHCRAASLLAAVQAAGDLSEAYDLLARRDPDAERAFARFRARLIEGLTALALAHAPSAIVVGGGAAQPGLLDGVESALSAGLWPGQQVAVKPAELGDAAALAGLGSLLRRPVRP